MADHACTGDYKLNRNLNALTESHPQLTSICAFNLWTSWPHVTNSVNCVCQWYEIWLPHIVAWIIGCTPHPQISLVSLLTDLITQIHNTAFCQKNGISPKESTPNCCILLAYGSLHAVGSAGVPSIQNKWYMTYKSAWILLLCYLVPCYWQF
jgi:hypothetical protein